MESFIAFFKILKTFQHPWVPLDLLCGAPLQAGPSGTSIPPPRKIPASDNVIDADSALQCHSFLSFSTNILYNEKVIRINRTEILTQY